MKIPAKGGRVKPVKSNESVCLLLELEVSDAQVKLSNVQKVSAAVSGYSSSKRYGPHV